MSGDLIEVKKNDGLQEVIINRQAQEVQAAMIMAKKFPRDTLEAFNRIRKACQRKGLAKEAEYSYPRGGEKVTGPSIRLAEVLAQNWGNLDYGILELNRTKGNSEMMAYAWDMETNTRRTMVFTVNHIREKRSGNVNLVDGRDIYEMTANMGARRVRACILAVIPGDVIEDALVECKKTLSSSYKEPLKARAKKMVAEFDDKHSVTIKMIEEYFGYNLEALSELDYEKLVSIFNSLKDGVGKRTDWFKIKVKSASSLDEKGEEHENDKKDSI